MARFIAPVLVGLTLLAQPAGAAGTGGGGNSAVAPAAQRLTEAEALIRSGRLAAASELLRKVVADQPSNADAWNLLGFAYRKLQRFDQAERAYRTALRLDPRHLGALEYQGELYIQTDRLELARANLDRLRALCGRCREYRELHEAISAAPGS